jgi:hypothetical protein
LCEINCSREKNYKRLHRLYRPFQPHALYFGPSQEALGQAMVAILAFDQKLTKEDEQADDEQADNQDNEQAGASAYKGPGDIVVGMMLHNRDPDDEYFGWIRSFEQDEKEPYTVMWYSVKSATAYLRTHPWRTSPDDKEPGLYLLLVESSYDDLEGSIQTFLENWDDEKTGADPDSTFYSSQISDGLDDDEYQANQANQANQVRNFGFYMRSMLHFFKGANDEERIAAFRKAALAAYDRKSLLEGQSQTSKTWIGYQEQSADFAEQVEHGFVFCRECCKDTVHAPQLARMGRCTPHYSSNGYPVRKYLRLILGEANVHGDLEITQQQTYESIVETANDLAGAATKGYGQFLLLLAMFDPDRPYTRLITGRWKRRGRRNRHRFEWHSVKLWSLSERLQHWIENPKLWLNLHHCGNGMTTFRCDNWRHMFAGPHVLNMRHLAYHRIFRVLRMVDTAHPVYLQHMEAAQLEFQVDLYLLVYN